MWRLVACFALFVFSVSTAQASSVVQWVSDTAYIVFDGTAQANIIGSGVIPSGSADIAYGKPQIEMSALVTGKAISTGVGATDASISKTITAIGSALAADAAAGSACSGGGLWGFIGCAALSAITQAAVFLGVDKLWNWLFGSANSGIVTTTSTGPAPLMAGSPMYEQDGCPLTAYPQGGGSLGSGSIGWGSTPTAAEASCLAETKEAMGISSVNTANWSGIELTSGSVCQQSSLGQTALSAGATCWAAVIPVWVANDSWAVPTGWYNLGAVGTPNYVSSPNSNVPSCASGGAFYDGQSFQCVGTLATSVVTSGSQSTSGGVALGGSSTSSVASAVSSLSSSELSGAADSDTVADMIDAAWLQASRESGYSGVPYPSSDPIQGSDVTTWETNNPGFAPSLGDDLGVGSGVGSQGNNSTGTVQGSLPQNGTSSAGDAGPNSTSGSSTSTGAGTSTGASGTTGSTGTGTATGASGTDGSSGSSTSLFCDVFPNASACAPLGSVTASTLPASSVAVSMNSPWNIGPSNGTCPAPVTVVVFGASINLDYTPICIFAERVQPLVLALCALCAAFIVIRGLKS